jgi:hypothetical protein
LLGVWRNIVLGADEIALLGDVLQATAEGVGRHVRDLEYWWLSFSGENRSATGVPYPSESDFDATRAYLVSLGLVGSNVAATRKWSFGVTAPHPLPQDAVNIG